MKVVVLFDGELPGRTPDLLIRETVKAVESALTRSGHDVTTIGARPDGRWIEKVRQAKADLVFNLCEGIDGNASFEPAVVSALELLGIPFTGNASFTLSVCLRKHLVNAHLHAVGVPVPRWALARKGDPIPHVELPAICKPAAEDASLGVEQKSVATTRQALVERVEALHERWDDIIVQRYVEGRELNVGILGDIALPVSEIDFGSMPDGKWKIVTFRSKWDPGSEEDVGTAPRCPADLSPRITERVQRVALQAWRAVGGQGYGRVDFRLDRTGRPWVLEVNPNPDFSPTAGLTRMAAAVGIDYRMMVLKICELALAKSRAIPVGDRWELARSLSGIASAEDVAASRGRP